MTPDLSLLQWLRMFDEKAITQGGGSICGICRRTIPSGVMKITDERGFVSVDCDLAREKDMLIILGIPKKEVLKIRGIVSMKEVFILLLLSDDLNDKQRNHLSSMLIRYGGQKVVDLINSQRQQVADRIKVSEQ